ncbi:DUF3060 domain-containing protein [Streptomyces sp. NPDC051976]|uniref:DUF3060 domain-containing protein n=1 Tax=Streptomyces sp. NPDC051976 TaxID=3154947 RepID=UPI00343B3AFF
MRIQKLLPITLVVLALSTTVGCSVDLSQPAKSEPTQTSTPQLVVSDSNSPSATARNPSSPTADAALTFSGNDVTQTIDCSGRDVVIDGSENTLMFKGTCGTVTVDGTDNSVAVNSVDTIQVRGKVNAVYLKTVGTIQTTDATNATVDWVGGVGGNSPKMSGGGRLNTVEQISEQEYQGDLT